MWERYLNTPVLAPLAAAASPQLLLFPPSHCLEPWIPPFPAWPGQNAKSAAEQEREAGMAQGSKNTKKPPPPQKSVHVVIPQQLLHRLPFQVIKFCLFLPPTLEGKLWECHQLCYELGCHGKEIPRNIQVSCFLHMAPAINTIICNCSHFLKKIIRANSIPV